MMLKTDIDAIAAAVRLAYAQTGYSGAEAFRLLASSLADTLAERTKYPPQRWLERNPGKTWAPQFDRAAFLKACGVQT